MRRLIALEPYRLRASGRNEIYYYYYYYSTHARENSPNCTALLSQPHRQYTHSHMMRHSMGQNCIYFFMPFFMLTSVTCQEHLEEADCVHVPRQLPNITVPITPFALPASFAAASLPQDPSIQWQIHNTLALYPLAIDGKNFAALNRIFTCDVIANCSAPLNLISGLSNLQAVLNQSLLPVTTQHSFGTQIIIVLVEALEAKSVTYFTATHFGQGVSVGQVRYPLFQKLRRGHDDEDMWLLQYIRRLRRHV